MFKADYMENEEFKLSLKNGVMHTKIITAFQNEKYKNISELTTQEVIEQLHLRANIHDLLVNNDPAAGHYIEPWLKMYLSDSLTIHRPDDIQINIFDFMKERFDATKIREIIKSTGISEITTLREIRAKAYELQAFMTDIILDEPKVLSYLNSVTPLSVEKVYEMARVAESKELSPVDSFSAHHTIEANIDVFAPKLQYSPGENIVVAINLSHYTNKEILEDISRLLDTWRQECAIELRQDSMKVSNNSLRKIITNKYIMLLDTMIANQLYPGVISDELILSLVYTHLNIEPESLRKTYRKNALAFADVQCLRTWERTLTHAGVWDMPIQQAITEDF